MSLINVPTGQCLTVDTGPMNSVELWNRSAKRWSAICTVFAVTSFVIFFSEGTRNVFVLLFHFHFYSYYSSLQQPILQLCLINSKKIIDGHEHPVKQKAKLGQWRSRWNGETRIVKFKLVNGYKLQTGFSYTPNTPHFYVIMDCFRSWT